MVEADMKALEEQLEQVSSEELDEYFKITFKATLRGLPELPKGTWENELGEIRTEPNSAAQYGSFIWNHC